MKLKTMPCIILQLYAVFATRTKRKTYKKKEEKKSKTLHRCKSRGFPPGCIFLRCFFADKGCIFQFLSNINSDAKRRASPQCPPNTDSGYSFYVFIKGFQRWDYILLFFCLNCTRTCEQTGC